MQASVREPCPTASPRLAGSSRFRIVCMLAVLALALLGCSSGDEDPQGCEQVTCAPGTRCDAGECRTICIRDEDCAEGLTCSASAGSDGVCSTPRGRFVACTDDAECDARAGFRCVAEQCQRPCRSHFDCRQLGRCAATPAGTYCTDAGPATPGQYYTACPDGPEQCDANAGFVCLGAGVGDLDAYCTGECQLDAECPDGFECSTVPAIPCGNACGVRGEPLRAGCAPIAEIGPGKRFACGPLGVVRNVCQKRAFCSSCESDADCLAVPGQICARDQSGEKICTVPCDPAVDSCPWGNSTRCDIWDAELGVPTCSHRFGACSGSGRGCEPCIDDAACGEGFCARSSFTGERFCVDLAVECDCAGDADANGFCTGHGCPTTPGKLPMICYVGSGPGDPLANRCIGASSSAALLSSPQSGCWRR